MSKTKGMPLGNLTSQFFANVYLNELDQFVKHKLKVKYYIRYVDDFVILHESKKQLTEWKGLIDNFLNKELKIMLHPNKSQVLKLEKGIKFLGFRIFYHHKLIRKSNLNNFDKKFNQMKFLFNEGFLTREKVFESIEGWMAYACYGNTYKYRKHIIKNFNKLFPYEKRKGIRNKSRFKNFIKKTNESELEFSTQKTLFLFLRGQTINEISKKRCLKENTIWGHIANLIGNNQIPLIKVLPKDKIYKIITKIYSKNDKLKDIRKRIKDKTISYNEIACVMANIKSKRKYSPS